MKPRLKVNPKCCGREMILTCSCGANNYCPVCENGQGQIPCDCSSPWDREISGVLTEYDKLWTMLADNDTIG